MNTSAFGTRCAAVLVAHEDNNGWVDPSHGQLRPLLLRVENGAHRHQATNAMQGVRVTWTNRRVSASEQREGSDGCMMTRREIRLKLAWKIGIK